MPPQTGAATYIARVLDVVGLGRLELPTPCLSGTYSNQLSYRPISSRTPDDAAPLEGGDRVGLSKIGSSSTVRTWWMTSKGLHWVS